MRISDWSSDVCSSDLQAFTAETLTWPGYGTAAENRLSCDPLGCLYRAGERRVAVLLDPRAAADDCAIAAVVVRQEPLRRQPCREPERVIDRFAVWREGADAVRSEERRVGKRCVGPCRSWRSADPYKKKKK